MKEIPKKIKRELAKLCGIAYERYLEQALGELEREFNRWKNKEIDAFELKEQIHKFHQGPDKDLYVYFSGSNSMNNIRVAKAIVEGVLEKSEVSQDTYHYLEKTITTLQEEFY